MHAGEQYLWRTNLLQGCGLGLLPTVSAYDTDPTNTENEPQMNTPAPPITCSKDEYAVNYIDQLLLHTSLPHRHLNVHTNLFWDASNEKAAVVDTHADSQRSALADFVVVQHSHGLLRLHWVAVHHEGIPTVLSTKVHHESHLVNTSNLLEHGHQFVFKAVSRDLADKDLASPGRWRTVPIRWRPVATLPVLLHDAVSRTGHELRYGRRSVLQRGVEAGFLARGRRESGFGVCRLARLALLLVFHTDRRAHGERGEEDKRNSE